MGRTLLAPDDDDRARRPHRSGAPLPFEGRTRAARADQTTVRQTNLGVVLRRIAAAGSCSRAEVAAATGLTRGTVSSLVNELVELELVRETGETAAPRGVGRPGQTLELADVLVGVGLEVNVDYVAVSLEDLTGAVRHEHRAYGDNRGSAPGPVLDRLGAAARDALAVAAREELRPIGVSVAVPGLVEEGSGTVVLAPNLGWHGVPVARELERGSGCPSTSRTSRTSPRWPSTGPAPRSGSTTSSASSARSGSGAASSWAAGSSAGHTASAASSATCPSTLPGTVRMREPRLRRDAGRAGVDRPRGGRLVAAGRTRSVTDELVRRADDGRSGRPRRAARRRPLARSRARLDLQLLDLEAVVLGGCFGPLAPGSSSPCARRSTERSLAARSGSFDGAAVGVRGRRCGPGRRRDLASPRARRALGGGRCELERVAAAITCTTGRRGRGREVAIGRR